MQRTIDGLCRGLEFLIALALAIAVLLVFGNVVLRYGFNSGITVSEEVSRWLFIWGTFMGAIVALREHGHLGMDMVVSRLPDPGAVMFHDAASMARVLGRAVEDGAWRDGESARLGARARERVSYRALARRLVSFVSERLTSDGRDARRWYDGDGTAGARTR